MVNLVRNGMISPKRIHPFNFTEISGVEVYASVETDIQSNSPVILLTARSALSQVLQSFQAGASDKSFYPCDAGFKDRHQGRVMAALQPVAGFGNSQRVVEISDSNFISNLVRLQLKIWQILILASGRYLSM